MTKFPKNAAPLSPTSTEPSADSSETLASKMAHRMVRPELRHAAIGSAVAEKMVGQLPGSPDIHDFRRAIAGAIEATRSGDLSLVSELLTAQAVSLDAMFTELARRATMNFGDHPVSAERYARLAFKAQATSRAALEALVKFHLPREQTVRHVHVNDGGQAVVTEHFHHHKGGTQIGEAKGQPHATGTSAAGASTPMSGPHPVREAVPLPCRQGEVTLQDARRQR